ncbi:MAG: hypothetical protein R3C49_26770 [Planctomycetaceae bacterium]
MALQAAQVVMTNVQTEWVNRADHGADEQNSGLVCECDVLSLNHCVLTSRPDGGRSRALEWKARTGTGSVITITDCVFTGTGYGLWFHQPPGRCSLQNALFETQRAAMRCDLSEPGAQDITLRLRQLTVPGGISLLDAVVLNDQVGDVRVQLECSESVLLPTLGLVQFASSGHWPVSRAAVEFQLPERGNPAIVSPGMRPAVAWDSQLQHVVALNENQVRTDALLYAAPVFADPAAIEPSGESTSLYRRYQLIDYEGPKLNQQMPGIDSSRLP